MADIHFTARLHTLVPAAGLKAEGATRSHVILDSCNSFFVLNARKPGEKLQVKIIRAGKQQTVTVTLGAQPRQAESG